MGWHKEGDFLRAVVLNPQRSHCHYCLQMPNQSAEDVQGLVTNSISFLVAFSKTSKNRFYKLPAAAKVFLNLK